jgi:hypothetical protein
MKRKIGRTLGMLLVVGLVVAVPAFAIDRVYHPEGSYAELHPSYNNRIHACDRDVDGHRVRAWYYTSIQYPDEPTYSAWAPSGGCSDWQGSSWGLPIARFRVCVEAEGCSGWWVR